MDPVTAMLLLQGGKMLFGGLKAGFTDESAGLAEAAEGIFDATKNVLGKAKNIAYDTADLAVDKAGDVKDFGIFKTAFGSRAKNASTLGAGKKLFRKGGFAEQTQVGDIVQTQLKSTQELYSGTMKNIGDTYGTAVDAADLSKRGADVAYEKGLGDAQEKLNAMLQDAEDRDKGFFEGAFGG